VQKRKMGERVTVPFAVGCGVCPECLAGNHQVCPDQFQPGFTAWGSFAEYVALPRADANLVVLPDALSFVDAASLGCRFVTASRAVVAQGRVTGGEWVAVHGCGGVGLSAIMIASALGANVVAVDISEQALALAYAAGAAQTVNASGQSDVAGAVRELTGGGAHVALDALGSRVTCRNSILSLRRRGRHVQVGLMLAEEADPPLPMGRVIAWELELYGSHGMQAHAYGPMLAMIQAGKLNPAALVTRRVTLAESAQALVEMGRFAQAGVTVIDRFR
jgi:alcohol dehydrogenase